MDTEATKYRRKIGLWRSVAIVAIVAFLVALIAIIVMATKGHQLSLQEEDSAAHSMPCPESSGGLLTSGDPTNPSPFHDLTTAEYHRVYAFLRKQKSQLNLMPPHQTFVNTSSIFMMDLMLPPKSQVLSYLDQQAQQPPRQARVMIYRGDKKPPVVEEYRVGPLSQEEMTAELIENPKRRNSVEFDVRPIGGLEYFAIFLFLFPVIDAKVGYILQESYDATFTECGNQCLTFYPAPVGTELIGAMDRKMWFMTNYRLEYYTLHPLDFGMLLNVGGSDPSTWNASSVWYSGVLYDSLDDLKDKYDNDPNTKKTRMTFPPNPKDLTSTQRLRGDPKPDPPQRPPMQMEPDGKRYSVHHRHVSYLHWEFDLRLSAFTGPQVYDVRFQGHRIAYQLGVAEIAVFYAGWSPMQRIINFVDSGALIGTHSKSLVPGVDCPEHATFLNVSFLGEGMDQPTELARAQCVFEQNTGVPLRRHMSYSQDQGGFYGGMSDSVLVARSILTIVNYDYIVDFIFHQSGAVECRAISTGYITSSYYNQQEGPYGFRVNDVVNPSLHHHMFNFKADLDLGGTSNRYETLDITEETVPLVEFPGTDYRQIRFDRHLYNTENEAVYNYNFNQPRYHIVHNEQMKTEQGVPRAYRLHMSGMSKQLLTKGKDNEKTIPWARQQLAVTVHDDDEHVSSSPYAMFDSLNPVTDFSTYINNQNIVDKDLVFWITLGTHHIPHTEDIPVTPTVGGHLSFFLLPYNYFPECPSVSSRDNVRVEFINPEKPTDGLKVDRSGNKAEKAVCGMPSLEQLVKERPDDFVQTHRDFRLV